MKRWGEEEKCGELRHLQIKYSKENCGAILDPPIKIWRLEEISLKLLIWPLIPYDGQRVWIKLDHASESGSFQYQCTHSMHQLIIDTNIIYYNE